MLAKEQQKLSQENKDDNDEEEDDNDDDDGNVHQDVSAAPTVSEDFSDQSALSNKEASSTAPTTASTEQMASSSTTKKSAASTAEQYPVSSTGHCPYCGSTDVKYIIVVSENTQDSDLPATLQQLLKSNHAFKMAKGEVHWASETSRAFTSFITLQMKIVFTVVAYPVCVRYFCPVSMYSRLYFRALCFQQY